MISSLLMSLQATQMAHNSAARMMNTAQRQMALANSVDGSESPAERARINRMETALRFQGLVAQYQWQAAMNMQEAAQRMQEREQRLKERLMANGATFV